MRLGTGLAGIAVVFGCLGIAACGTDPTGARTAADHNYSVGALPPGEGDGGNGGDTGGETTTQSDTTTQRGIGGFGSGN
jgi:hypothetical protein